MQLICPLSLDFSPRLEHNGTLRTDTATLAVRGRMGAVYRLAAPRTGSGARGRRTGRWSSLTCVCTSPTRRARRVRRPQAEPGRAPRPGRRLESRYGIGLALVAWALLAPPATAPRRHPRYRERLARDRPMPGGGLDGGLARRRRVGHLDDLDRRRPDHRRSGRLHRGERHDGTITFGAEDAAFYFTELPWRPTRFYEGDETLTFTLSDPVGATLGEHRFGGRDDRQRRRPADGVPGGGLVRALVDDELRPRRGRDRRAGHHEERADRARRVVAVDDSRRPVVVKTLTLAGSWPRPLPIRCRPRQRLTPLSYPPSGATGPETARRTAVGRRPTSTVGCRAPGGRAIRAARRTH